MLPLLKGTVQILAPKTVGRARRNSRIILRLCFWQLPGCEANIGEPALEPRPPVSISVVTSKAGESEDLGPPWQLWSRSTRDGFSRPARSAATVWRCEKRLAMARISRWWHSLFSDWQRRRKPE
ncbi:hypothetical protein HDV57DRAFT_492264 [Trichoderma longibrachiatum]|uniref:Uncharacterized protein n=1 Tax=Trichoderma longibrachiatum ATCC 18648 TaxID=983965 RepID=A0A2T4C2U0_TRILO|nr:hypothetical protein M440DRAFT_331741 [Trichoderma longibrachiatum ATCC 18648]